MIADTLDGGGRLAVQPDRHRRERGAGVSRVVSASEEQVRDGTADSGKQAVGEGLARVL